MQYVITGGTGFIGTALRLRLLADGHEVVTLSRKPGPDTVAWDPAGGRLDPGVLDGVDGVVNLAGAGIADRPHTAARLRVLSESRLRATQTLVDALGAVSNRPPVLLSASAMGYYGDRNDEVLTESEPPGDDPLGTLCRDWEAAARRAEDLGVRTALLRTSIVLDDEGGALAKQLPLYRLGLGARAGRGDQWLSWITLDDHVSAMVHLLTHDVSGPVNMSTTEPVTNAAFTKAVASHLGRPSFLVIPSFVRRLPLGLGPLAESLLFTSCRLEPVVLQGSGFEPEHPDLDGALTAVLGA